MEKKIVEARCELQEIIEKQNCEISQLEEELGELRSSVARGNSDTSEIHKLIVYLLQQQFPDVNLESVVGDGGESDPDANLDVANDADEVDPADGASNGPKVRGKKRRRRRRRKGG